MLAIGCDDIDPMTEPDAAVPADVSPVSPVFFGQPCTPPSTLGTVVVCRPEPHQNAAYCNPMGTCRPFCDTVYSADGTRLGKCTDVGGREVWAFGDSAARVCYCEPR